VGVLARLCSHLGKMTGLTIRATVSQLNRATDPLGLSHVGRALNVLPNFRRSVPQKIPATRNTVLVEPTDIRRRQVRTSATTTALQPPAVADGKNETFIMPRSATPLPVHSNKKRTANQVTKGLEFYGPESIVLNALVLCYQSTLRFPSWTYRPPIDPHYPLPAVP
jgi:hypothetical protein